MPSSSATTGAALVAWTLACYEPKSVRRLAVVSAPHPLRLRAALFRRPDKHAATSGRCSRPGSLNARSAVPARAASTHCFTNGLLPAGLTCPPPSPTGTRSHSGNTAYCAAEYHRWFVRSIVRPDGARFRKRLQTPVTAPVLQVHGSVDGCYPAVTRTRIQQVRRSSVPMAPAGRGRPLPARGRPGSVHCRAGLTGWKTQNRTADQPQLAPASGVRCSRRNRRLVEPKPHIDSTPATWRDVIA